MIKVWLTGKNGKNSYAIIDDDDVQRITEYPWSLHKYGYACTNIDGKQVPMHRFVTDAPPRQYVDHKNMNKLDNRKENLRFCTFNQNLSNTKPRFDRKYKGVYEEKHKKLRRFHAYARVDNKVYSFGRYLTAEEAALAYDKNMRVLRGEFAYLNFPEIVDYA